MKTYRKLPKTLPLLPFYQQPSLDFPFHPRKRDKQKPAESKHTKKYKPQMKTYRKLPQTFPFFSARQLSRDSPFHSRKQNKQKRKTCKRKCKPQNENSQKTQQLTFPFISFQPKNLPWTFPFIHLKKKETKENYAKRKHKSQKKKILAENTPATFPFLSTQQPSLGFSFHPRKHTCRGVLTPAN